MKLTYELLGVARLFHELDGPANQIFIERCGNAKTIVCQGKQGRYGQLVTYSAPMDIFDLPDNIRLLPGFEHYYETI